jgi:hypothetical protein
MTKNEALAELMKVTQALENHVRGKGSLTALKKYQRKLYAIYTA